MDDEMGPIEKAWWEASGPSFMRDTTRAADAEISALRIAIDELRNASNRQLETLVRLAKRTLDEDAGAALKAMDERHRETGWAICPRGYGGSFDYDKKIFHKRHGFVVGLDERDGLAWFNKPEDARTVIMLLGLDAQVLQLYRDTLEEVPC